LVLPVGGIKEKVLAAKRAGITTVILPQRNEKDLEEIPEPIKKEMRFHFVQKMDEIIPLALSVASRNKKSKKKRGPLSVSRKGA
jgi:ATP-dependent Lon protease